MICLDSNQVMINGALIGIQAENKPPSFELVTHLCASLPQADHGEGNEGIFDGLEIFFVTIFCVELGLKVFGNHHHLSRLCAPRDSHIN